VRYIHVDLISISYRSHIDLISISYRSHDDYISTLCYKWIFDV